MANKTTNNVGEILLVANSITGYAIEIKTFT